MNLPKQIKVQDFLRKIGHFAKENFGRYEIREGKGSSLKIEFFYDHQDYKAFEPALVLTIYEKDYVSRDCLRNVMKDFDKAGLGNLKEELLKFLNN